MADVDTADIVSDRIRFRWPTGAAWGWLGPLAVTGLGAWLRFADLGTPRDVVFDESYYAPQAYGILRFGAEHAVTSFADSRIVGGDTSGIFIYGGQFAAHPPFGKVQIALGEWLFGVNPFGWRFAVALVGTLSILLLARITRRLTGSTLLGSLAGLLLALDGLELVLSRIAMLDVFVMFWVLAAFGCLLIDRDRADALPAVRWWRLAAGVCLGLAISCKWNALYFLAGFTILSIAWGAAGRRTPRRLLREGAATVAGLWPIAGFAYLATWRGWFASTIGWDRYYAQQHGVNTPVVSALYSWAQYQREMFDYGTSLSTPNTFASHPWTWLLLTHPVRFYYAAPRFAQSGCRETAGCVQNVLAVGTPAIWWAAIPALAVALVWWLRRRDRRFGAALAGVAAGWLPWFALPGRTQYFYYAVSFEPFLILALVLCLGLVLGPAGASRRRRLTGASLVGAYVVAVALDFAFLYPVLTGRPISYAAWISRMLMPNWI